MRLVLDMGSGNTCMNKKSVVKQMIDRLYWADNKRCDIVLKWQLFKNPIDNNIPLDRDIFEYAYHYAKKLGYHTTASVFDKDSLRFLLGFDIPFVKFSCNTPINDYVGSIPKDIFIYKSFFNGDCCCDNTNKILYLSCIPSYPASDSDYFELIGTREKDGFYFISDHTIGWNVYDRYKPVVYECHYKLSESVGLDAGVFARTPDMLRRIIG